MFKENREFWFYVIGTIILFVIIIFSAKSYFSPGIFNFFSSQPKKAPVTQLIYEGAPSSNINTADNYFARIKTNMGEIVIDLLEKSAPNTVNNFVYLALDDYYDGVRFHRLIPGILLQGGSRNTLNDDPNDDAYGGPGYIFPDEINWDSLDLPAETRRSLTEEGYSNTPKLFSEDIDKYTVAMANAGPNTNGSQFFILLAGKDKEQVNDLRGKHTVFARVIENTALVDNFAEMNAYEDGNPEHDIFIEDIEIFIDNSR